MEELLKFLVSSVIGNENFNIEKEDNNSDLITFNIKPKKEDAGILIGKDGKNIKSIIQILKMKASIEKKKVVLRVVT